MLSNIKNSLKKSKFVKWFSVMAIAAFCVVGSALTCFAADPSGPDMSATLTSSFNSIQSNIFTYIGICLPIALAIVGAMFGIKYAINFFRSIARKS